MRLNRYLAQCGVASRRHAEDLIAGGRVTLNGAPARTPALQVEPGKDRVEVDGEVVELPAGFAYYLMHKPAGFDVTRADRFAERLVYDLLPPDAPAAVQAVGRLDRETTGLLLLTNDGDLAFRLTHPRFEVEKEYLAFGEGPPTEAQIRIMLRGVELEDGPARADRVERIGAREAERLGLPGMPAAGLRLVIHQGRKRIVRRLCEAAGYPLIALHRTRVGGLELGGLKMGEVRQLGAEEIAALRREAGLPGK